MSSGSFLHTYKFELLLLLVFCYSLGVKMYRLEIPESYYFDEVYYAFTAQEMAKGNEYAWENVAEAPEDFAYEWSHPPLGKEISALGIMMFGNNTFGWRFFQALIGSLGTLFIYLLAKNLFQSKGAGLLASLVYSLDSFVFVLSRITMVDIFIANFLILAAYFVVKYAFTRRYLYLVLSGIFCAACASVKWSGVYILVFFAGVSFLLVYYHEVYSEEVTDGAYVSSLFRILPGLALAFILVPIVIYIATYIPYFYFGNSIMDFLRLQGNMLDYHGGVTDPHPYRSEWWKWPFMLRPVYLYFDDAGNAVHSHIYALGNPFIWWSGFLFFILGIFEVIRKEKPALTFAVAGAVAFWLPWALSPRKITFLYHYLPTLMFIFLIIAYYLNSIWYTRYGKIVVIFYLLVSAAVFVYFYPILAAVPMNSDAIDRFMWLNTWR